MHRSGISDSATLSSKVHNSIYIFQKVGLTLKTRSVLVLPPTVCNNQHRTMWFACSTIAGPGYISGDKTVTINNIANITRLFECSFMTLCCCHKGRDDLGMFSNSVSCSANLQGNFHSFPTQSKRRIIPC